MRIAGDKFNKFSNGFTGAEIPLVWTQDDNVFKHNKVYTEKNEILPVDSLGDMKKATVRFFTYLSGTTIFGPDAPVNTQKITISGEGKTLCFKPPTGQELLPTVKKSFTDTIDLVRCETLGHPMDENATPQNMILE